MEPTPNHGDSGSSKRRRLDNAATPGTANLQRFVASRTDSPIAHTPLRLPTNNVDDATPESPDDLPHTQDPSAINPIQLPQVRDASDSANTTEFSPIVPLQCLPPVRVNIIKRAIREVYGFDNPRQFQIEAINHLAFTDDSSLVLIRRTADGKSLVPLTVTILRGGITLILVPLHGLGSDQVDKAASSEHGIEAYYVDEHKYDDAKVLEERLSHYSAEESEHNSILLFASPNSLKDGSRWIKLFRQLAVDGLIKTVAIDEAHEIEQSGRSFRTEFVDAAKSLDALVKSMPTPVPRILMSATFRRRDYATVSKLFNMSSPAILQGSLARRNTEFQFQVFGDPVKSLLRSSSTHMQEQPDMQQLWYCNSRTTCEGPLLEKADKMIDKYLRPKNIKSSAHSFTGGDGLKMKSGLIDAFTKYRELPGESSINPDGTVTLPKISVMTATSAANCGVSSNDLSTAMHKGFPFSMYDLVQEMGRVNRTQQLDNCSFQIHASLDCFVSSFVRLMTNDEYGERMRTVAALTEVLRFLIIPDRCYHSFIETYFEWDSSAKVGCGDMCSFCKGHASGFTGVFKRMQVVGILTKQFREKLAVSGEDLKRALRDNKKTIFTVVPKTMGPIHALLLQLIANGILNISVSDVSKIGQPKLTTKDVVLKLATTVEDGIEQPAYMLVSTWRQMTFI
eukprot:scaffold81936_cov56-Cyclotella_meneghiniana.AAC.2